MNNNNNNSDNGNDGDEDLQSRNIIFKIDDYVHCIDWSNNEHIDLRTRIPFPTYDYWKQYTNQHQVQKLIIRYYPYDTMPSHTTTGLIFQNLIELKFYNCDFTQFPQQQSIFGTTTTISNNLKILEIIRCNNIRQLLPSSGLFGGLQKLEELKVESCASLTQLPESIGRLLPSLKVFYLEGCRRITLVPMSIGEMTNLTELRLILCPSLTELPVSIGGLQKLKKLWIHTCPGMVRLPPSIGKLHNLQELLLTLTRIKSLPNEICNVTSLQTLEIQNPSSHPSVIDAIIRNLPNLSNLKLSTSVFHVNSLPLLPQLKSLHLTLNMLNLYAPFLTMFDVNGWKENSTLEELDIMVQSGQQISDFGNILIALPKKLKKFNLIGCQNINGLLDTLTSADLPEGLTRLRLKNCCSSRAVPYTDGERSDCIRNLVERYTRLGYVHIIDAFSNPFVLPKRELYLMKYNQCGGRVLLLQNEQDNNTTTTDSTTKKNVPLSIWSVVLERVHGYVRQDCDDFAAYAYHRELEASILFQLLQGPAFLGRNNF